VRSPIRYRCPHCRALSSLPSAIPRSLVMDAPVSAGPRVAGTLVAEQSLTAILRLANDHDSHN
jgi:hypothetical protein